MLAATGTDINTHDIEHQSLVKPGPHTVSVVMRSILDVDDASMSCVLLLVPVACELVAVSLTDAVSVCGAVSVGMRSRLDVGRRVDVMDVDATVVCVAASVPPGRQLERCR
jgi:hypothetical protein